jgi:hypothetical protein
MYYDTICTRLTHTHDKNERVFLWLLEQDRQKNRIRILRETERNLVAQEPDAPDRSWFDGNKFDQDEERRPILSENAEYEQLMEKKAVLEEQSRFLDEKQKQLDLHAKMLCGKIIQEIKKRNNERQQKVSCLREKIEQMEAQLELVSSIRETKEKNCEKHQEINQLRETIGALETQFGELGFSLISKENKTGKVENSPDITQLDASQKENPLSDRNPQALEFVEQSK